MTDNGQEIEAKFYVQDLSRIERRLEDLGVRLIQARVLETNIRFDLPGAALLSEGRVLRLRQDTEARLTYKGPSQNENGILQRTEIEFVASDFDKARHFLEALGYQKLIRYEKYRTTYQLNRTLVMLDELPFGNFVEIEGETVAAIRTAARQLKLDWGTAISKSYNALFERLRKTLELSFPDILFVNFANIKVEQAHLGVRPADSETNQP